MPEKLSEKKSAERYHEIDKDGPNWKVGVEGFNEGYEYGGEGFNYRIAVGNVVMESPEELSSVAGILATPFSESITRTMVRVVATGEALKTLPAELRADLEAVIDLSDSGNPDLIGCYQAIFGRNHETRQSPEEIVHEELRKADAVFTETPPLRAESRESIPEGYTLQRLDAASAKELVEGYRTLLNDVFGDDEGLGYLNEPDYLFVVALDAKSSVVGGAYAWKDSTALTRGGKPFELNTWEIEGATVHPEHRGSGLYTAIAATLMKELALKKDPPADVVFGFSNAAEGAVLRVAARLGRTPVTETARELGLAIKPAIGMDYLEGTWTDDFVTYIQGNKLRREFTPAE